MTPAGRNMTRVELLQMRLLCKEGDRGSLHVKSTFDKTERMEHRTDESISFTDDDLVVIKNCRESPCEITLEAIRMPDAGRILCSPSRQSAFMLTSKVASEIRYTRTLKVGGGESVVCRSAQWVTNRKRGNFHGTL